MGKKLKTEAQGRDPGGPSGGGIPALGAMGGGDSSYRLGRPRKPFSLTGGSPSMSADSGFASVDGMARVNKGYEDEEEDIIHYMFHGPDDDEEEEEIDNALRTRKLLNYTASTLGKKNAPSPDPMKLREGAISRALSDTLASALLTIPVLDAFIGSAYLSSQSSNASASLQTFGEMIGTSEQDLYDAVTGDDLIEFDEILEKIKSLDQDTKDAAREKFEDYLYYVKNYVITLAQAFDSAVAIAAGQAGPQAGIPEEIITVPAINIATGVTGYFLRLLPFERLLFQGSAKLAEMIVGMNEIEEAMATNRENNEYLDEIESSGGPAIKIIFFEPLRSIPRLGRMYREIREEIPPAPETEEDSKESIDDIEKKSEEANGSDDQEIEDQEDESADPVIDEPGTPPLAPATAAASISMAKGKKKSKAKLKIPEADPCPCPLSEIDIRYKGEIPMDKSKEALLREAIRGALIESAEILEEKKKKKKKPASKKRKKQKKKEEDEINPSTYGAVGFSKYEPDMVVPDPDAEVGEELARQYSNVYKADIGYFASQRRPISEGEALLREMIFEAVRQEMQAIDEEDLDEDLLDEEELEEDELDEVNAISTGGGSGVSTGVTSGGPNLPLGMSTPTFGRKRRTPAEAAGSGYGYAKPARVHGLAGLSGKK